MSDSDATLVARTLGGDLTAYAALMARYRDKFGRYAFHMLGNREDAQEALQDSFVRAYRSLASCRQPERFGAWLFRIVVNRCRTVRRRLQRDRRFDADLPDDVAAAGERPDAFEWRDEIGLALGQLGVDGYAATKLLSQFFGTAMLGLGLLLWFAKDVSEVNLQKGMGIALLVGAVGGLIITVMGTTSGILRANWWIAMVLYAILGLAYAYLLFLKPKQLSPG